MGVDGGQNAVVAASPAPGCGARARAGVTCDSVQFVRELKQHASVTPHVRRGGQAGRELPAQNIGYLCNTEWVNRAWTSCFHCSMTALFGAPSWITVRHGPEDSLIHAPHHASGPRCIADVSAG